VLVVVVALLVPSGVSALTHEPVELQTGAIDRPADGSTVIAVQGFKLAGQNSSKKPARLVGVGPEGDLAWQNDEDHSPAVEFRAEVRSDAGYPLWVRGRYNARAKTLSFAVIHRGVGRVYALDMGKVHHNPECSMVGECHKHHYSEQIRDKHAYEPQDITAQAHEPVRVWEQFCAEARITHVGTLPPPPDVQEDILS
jgi:hypothetical protein